MTHSRRSYLSYMFGIALASTGILIACDDSSSAGGTGNDGGTTPPTPPTGTGSTSPTPTPPPGPGNDAGADADAAASGPTKTEVLGTAGAVTIMSANAFAQYALDDQIVRWSDAPACVFYVRTPGKQPSAAGDMTFAGGALAAPVVITTEEAAASQNSYSFGIDPGDVYNPGEETEVQVEMEQVPVAFPPMPLQTHRPFGGTLEITAPSMTEENTVPSDGPLDITWTVPTGDNVATQEIGFQATFNGAGQFGDKDVFLYCGFPLNAGQATIPKSVLSDIRARIGGEAAATLLITAGGHSEVKSDNSTYVIDVGDVQGAISIKLQ